MNPEITIIVPVYNEEANIDEALTLIRSHMLQLGERFEMLIIDDGSKDRTWTRIEACCRRFEELSAIRLSRNFGKELALCAGLEQANGNAVIVMDADLQHPPALFSEMVHKWRVEGYEIVECVKRSRGKEPLQKKWGSALFYLMLNRMSGFDLHGASDFKLLDRKVIQAWRDMPERNTFFRGMTAWLGFSRAQIEFEVPERIGSTSRWGLVSLVKLAVQAVTSFSSLPLRFVNFAGALFLCGAIVLGAQTLYRKLVGEAVTGFTTVILLQLMIGSVIMVSLGIVGEYISAIYNETKHRPRYVVRERITAKITEETEEIVNELICVQK
ncbi:glycosyltransferase family 2 protein [Paenibacillus profundus]|uniref:Glycosyltransferase family 2 protein n=1 Tax=Paenibacillus profundus TaxID=1173085 RepID=A0ABS8YRP4_9BACL|nr:glycosyltransferase family 2 protein [Paenibacillus profundus]MCE5173290.1 glycosyltransferase family 2 protein [Paenibacillus profundus]